MSGDLLQIRDVEVLKQGARHCYRERPDARRCVISADLAAVAHAPDWHV
jgi:hypothetical protein